MYIALSQHAPAQPATRTPAGTPRSLALGLLAQHRGVRPQLGGSHPAELQHPVHAEQARQVLGRYPGAILCTRFRVSQATLRAYTPHLECMTDVHLKRRVLCLSEK